MNMYYVIRKRTRRKKY